MSFGRWRRLGALAVVVAVGMDKWDEFVHTGGWDVGARLTLALGVEAADRVMAASRDFHQIWGPDPRSQIQPPLTPAITSSWDHYRVHPSGFVAIVAPASAGALPSGE